MIELRLHADDLLRVRFAVSPLHETVGALRTLADPAAHAIHLPWVREARERVDLADLAMLVALVDHSGYIPDFLTPPPDTPLPSPEVEIARVRATPPAQVRLELRWTFEDEPLPAPVRRLARDPARGVAELADALEVVHARLIAPVWPRLRTLLDGDVLHRARRLGEAGIAGVLSDIHPLVRVAGDRILVAKPHDEIADLGGRGLLLLPSAFSWPDVNVIFDRPWHPTLIYPPRGLALLWAPGEAAPAALAGVVGATRARILSDLDAPRSTTELARRLEASAGGISEHLAALAAAGLVTGHRTGRVVLYARTDLGARLVAAAGAA
jgi:DNA-binding transcriptional ArsR family regulator